MKLESTAWKIYRTKYLVKAKCLLQEQRISDSMGREEVGKAGDYILQCADGSHRLATREVFDELFVEAPDSGLAPR